MKILNLIAQKPSSTGSGVYLSALVSAFDALGHSQAVVAGIYHEDIVAFPEDVAFYPVYYNSNALPFSIAGMSDTMPYESTIYSQMTPQTLAQMKEEFIRVITLAMTQFQPDIVLCHHLFWLAAWTRDAFPNCKLIGLSHGTDMRQLASHQEIIPQIGPHICKFDHLFALQSAQKNDMMQVFDVPSQQITIVGTGYDGEVFHKSDSPRWKTPTIIYAGKLSEQKGVVSLLHSMKHLQTHACLKLAGSAGNAAEREIIYTLAAECKIDVEFLGHLDHMHLAEAFRKSTVFVLPSFYEGLPLVLIEALACGTKVVCTDLPGVKEWIIAQLGEDAVDFVPLPKEDRLQDFEISLAKSIDEALRTENQISVDLTHLSWKNLAKRFLSTL